MTNTEGAFHPHQVINKCLNIDYIIIPGTVNMSNGFFSCTVVCSVLQSAGDDHYRCMHFCNLGCFYGFCFGEKIYLKNVTVEFLKISSLIFVI